MRLNVRSPSLNRGNINGLKKATERRRLHDESFEEAWARIESMKNSEADERRLSEVKKAMTDGVIGREPENANRRFSKAEALRLYRLLEEIKAEERLSDLVENMPDNYHLITSQKDLASVVKDVLSEELIVFDVETTGTDVYSDKIVGHVLSSTSQDKHYYIPTDHDDNQTQLDRDYVAGELRPIYEADSIKFIAHNAKFDIQMLKNDLGITVANLYWDTKIGRASCRERVNGEGEV